MSFHPLALSLLRDYEETHTDGSNEFIYSRFLVPSMQGYKGWAIFVDGDMLCRWDIADLWELRDESKAVMVAKHSYTSRFPQKFVGTAMQTSNVTYPRKNWSSVILWNCGHEANRVLTPQYVQRNPGSVLHRFEHLADAQIGEIPLEWNWLVGEYAPDPHARLVHYTLGVPGMEHYKNCAYASEWHQTRDLVNHVEQ